MLCIIPVIVIIIVVCPARAAHWRYKHRSPTMKRFTAAQLNQMHLIGDKEYLHDIYINRPRCFEITCTQWCSGACIKSMLLMLCPKLVFNGPAKDERPVS